MRRSRSFVTQTWQVAALALLGVTRSDGATIRPSAGTRGRRHRSEARLSGADGLDLQGRAGKTVRLGQYFTGKPVVLSLVYYRCPMLCNLVMNGELRAFRRTSA